MEVQEGLHQALELLLVYARLYLHTNLLRMRVPTKPYETTHIYTPYHEIENIFLWQAYDAVLFPNVPPVIVTRTEPPDIAMAPPASSALLPLNVPPSIEISDTPFPLQ